MLHRLADELLVVVQDTTNLEFKFQKLIAETAMLRLFYGIENAMANISCKLLMNSPYCDTPPSRPQFLPGIVPYRSYSAAEAAIVSLRRPRVRYLKWTQLADIQGNLQPFLVAGEYFVVERGVLDPVFEDMRRVRNHIAHSTKSTAAGFAAVVARIYPLQPRGITPGKLLLSQRTGFVGAPTGGRPRIIEQYLRWTKLATTHLVKG